MNNEALRFPDVSAPYTLFIADLHLSAASTKLNTLFIDFLASTFTKQADALYLLGDLFDFWLGDDLLDEVPYQQIAQSIATLVMNGVPVYFQVGNRDFLVGKRFFQETHALLLDDPYAIDLYEKPTLLSHGDIFCTDDIEYQKFRQHIRKPKKQQLFLGLPLWIRKGFFKMVVGFIKKNTSKKVPQKMDVTPSTLEEYQKKYHTAQIIHGHTHCPAIHTEGLRRIVLPDWRMSDQRVTGGILIATPHEQMIYTFDRSL